MLNNIDLLTQELICYLDFLTFPSLEFLIQKIPLALQETKLREITLESSPRENLSIIDDNKGKYDSLLNKDDLGKYSLNIEDFKKDIEDIKNKNPEKIFSEAIEEVIILSNKKLYKLYVPLAILVYASLHKKLKLEHPEVDSNGIYNFLDEKIENLQTNKERKLTYNYFKRAYQGYANPQGFAAIFNTINLETEKNLNTIFNITKKLQINFTHYQTSYTTLTDLIEELYICAEDKTATKVLINNLKFHTNICFSNLIQASFEKHAEKIVFTKTTIENFKSATRNLIKDYIEEHSDDCKKQSSILDEILEFIANMIPSFILSEDRKMTLFYTPSGIQIKNLNSQIKTAIRQHFVY